MPVSNLADSLRVHLTNFNVNYKAEARGKMPTGKPSKTPAAPGAQFPFVCIALEEDSVVLTPLRSQCNLQNSEGVELHRLRPFSPLTHVSWRLLLLFLCVSTALSAHHGVAAYDYSRTVVAKNVTVTQWDWMNPHCKIHFDVTDDHHNVQHWSVEMHPPEMLLEHGWTRQSLHTGDVISLSFRPAKDFSPAGLLDVVTLPNGMELVQNTLRLPEGKTMNLQEWANFIARK